VTEQSVVQRTRPMLPCPHPYYYRQRYTAGPTSRRTRICRVARVASAAFAGSPDAEVEGWSTMPSRQRVGVVVEDGFGLRNVLGKATRLHVADREGDSDHPGKVGRLVCRRYRDTQNDAVSASNTLQCRCKGCLTQKAGIINVTSITLPALNPSYLRSIKTSCTPALQGVNSED